MKRLASADCQNSFHKVTSALVPKTPMSSGHMQKFIRMAAWALLFAVVIATLGPMTSRPDTGMPLYIERFLALSAIGMTFRIAYPRHTARILLLLIVALASLELAQHLTPERHGTLLGFLEKAVGVGAGVVAGTLFSTMSNSG